MHSNINSGENCTQHARGWVFVAACECMRVRAHVCSCMFMCARACVCVRGRVGGCGQARVCSCVCVCVRVRKLIVMMHRHRAAWRYQ